jgi:exosortase
VSTRSTRSPALASLAPLGIGGLLAAFAFRDLLRFEPRRAIPDPVERLLFEPADTAPLVVIALALWLLYRRLGRWRRLRSGSAPLPVVAALLAASLGIFIWARLTSAADLLAVSALAGALAIAALWKGVAGLRLVLLPAFFLLFALPIPPALSNALIFRFQLWTAQLAGQMLFWLGMPAYVAGETILRVDYKFSVIEGCSGLRSVVTLTMLAVLMADLFHRRRRHAFLLVVLAPFVAFFLNAVRAVLLIVNPHSAIVSVHVAQGVAILLAGLLILYAIDGLLARVLPPAPPPDEGAPAGARGFAQPTTLAFLALLALLSVAVPHWIAIDASPLRLEARYGAQLGDWKGTPLPIDRLFLGSVAFRESLSSRYTSGDGAVELFLAVGDREQRFMSPLSGKTQLPGSGWVVDERAPLEVGAGGRDAVSLLVRSGARRQLVYTWSAGNCGAGCESLRSLLALDATPWRVEVDPLVVRISTDLAAPGEEERARARARLESLLPLVQEEVDKLLRQMEGLAKTTRRKGFS